MRILPRWVIIAIDIGFLTLSALLAYLLRFNFSLDDLQVNSFQYGVSSIVSIGVVAIMLTESYKGIIRYTGVQDGVRIIYMLLMHTALLVVLNLFYYYNTEHNLIPYSVILISFLASFLFLFNYRLVVKYIFSLYKRSIWVTNNVIIYGAGQTGIITRHVIESSPSTRVVGFLENDVNKVGKVLNGIPIYPAYISELENIIQDLNINELVITVKTISSSRKNELVDLCLRKHVKVRMVPPVEKWVKGELSLNQIKEINIEDLLERESIQLQDDGLRAFFKDKRICITGAAGSIGSEIVRQVLNYSPHSLILIDQAESPLFEVERNAIAKSSNCQLYTFIADITNVERIRAIMKNHKPEVIFHAAAYKHVPMMEGNPVEAIHCNVLGTKTLADLAVEFGVGKFVMISTDKAVNPTNVMGCSKRIAEIYVQSLNRHLNSIGDGKTSFVTTRFGNVLGSNGSVIPIFKKQIAEGGPVTVTHPDITRYFMTIPEACRLVLEAGTIGKGGEIFIFDMGQLIRIHDLAKRMILLSGLEPGKDIDIVFTGLREGEKLFEELLSNSENTIKTHHEKIMIAKVQEYQYTQVNSLIELFYDLMHDPNELKMVALMKELVPEFKSNYSRFEVLDYN